LKNLGLWTILLIINGQFQTIIGMYLYTLELSGLGVAHYPTPSTHTASMPRTSCLLVFKSCVISTLNRSWRYWLASNKSNMAKIKRCNCRYQITKILWHILLLCLRLHNLGENGWHVIQQLSCLHYYPKKQIFWGMCRPWE
jgi:hypothetical protein